MHRSCGLPVRYIFALIISVIFIAGCADRFAPPAEVSDTAEAGKTRLFDYRLTELDNGLDVITLEDFSCPIVTVQLWYHVGSKNERPDRQGFAHMFEHMMFRGTDRLGPTDHFNFVNRVGGIANGYTGFDRTVYFETLPASQLDLALWLEAERMAFLRIDEEGFETERKVVEEERRMQLNEPYGTLFEDIFAEVFKVHPYRWTPIGKIPHLRQATVEELCEFWQRYYVPNNAVLVIAGAISHHQAQAAARKYLGWIPRYPAPPSVTICEPPMIEAREVVLKPDNAPAPGAGVIYRSVPLRDSDAVVFDIIAEILGGGNSSRLYRQLVAAEQLAVGVKAENFSLEQDGLFGAGALLPVFSKDYDTVIDIIQDNIDRLRSEPVSQRELIKAKNQLSRGLVTQLLQVERKAGILASAAMEKGDIRRANTYLDEIRAVDTDDILRVANEYLSPDKVLKVKVERNLLGSFVKTRGYAEDEQSVQVLPASEKAEQCRRAGLARSDSFPLKPPMAKIEPPHFAIHHKSIVLDNGLKVMVVENHEVPFVSIQLGLLAGAWAEDANSVAAMTLKMLTKGTKNYTEAQLADELETYAISIDASATMDTSSVRAGCLSEHTDRAMKLLGEVVLRPVFPADEFEKLRRQVITSLNVKLADPSYQADKQFKRRLYGDHPYAGTVEGEPEDVNRLTVGQLKDWWSKFARPDSAVLIFSGDIDADYAFELARREFGKWYVSGEKCEKVLPRIKPPRQSCIYLVDRPGSVQSQIRVGQLGVTRHDEGYFVSRIVSNYFGWSFDSRLNRAVRVAKGLTYGIGGGYLANRFAGVFQVKTFTKTESTADTIRAIIEQIEALRLEPPSEKELEDSRSYILGSFLRNRETPQQIASDLWLIESQQLGDDYLQRFLNGVASADSQDCLEFVNRTVDPNSLIIVVVGEAEKLEADLSKICPVVLIRSD